MRELEPLIMVAKVWLHHHQSEKLLLCLSYEKSQGRPMAGADLALRGYVNSSVHIVTCFLEIFTQNLHHTCHLVAALRITEANVEGEIGPYVCVL